MVFSILVMTKKQKSTENNGMKTKVFGPMYWKTIHFTAMGYPIKPTRKQKNDYRNFLKYVSRTLPCGLCRSSFIKYLEENPMDDNVMSDRKSFVFFTFKLHNLVNEKLGHSKLKKKDFQKMYDKYEMYRSSGCKSNALGC
jgi:hypothetical protein